MSIDHAPWIRVLASPEAVDAYTGRTAAFPVGAIVLKEEFDQRDTTCSGPIMFRTAMRKLDAGTSPDMLDWEWQKVDADLNEFESDPITCVACHTVCGRAPAGYDGTCTDP